MTKPMKPVRRWALVRDDGTLATKGGDWPIIHKVKSAVLSWQFGPWDARIVRVEIREVAPARPTRAGRTR